VPLAGVSWPGNSPLLGEHPRLISPFDRIAGLDREANTVKCERWWSFDGNPVSLRHFSPLLVHPAARIPQRSETVNHHPARLVDGKILR